MNDNHADDDVSLEELSNRFARMQYGFQAPVISSVAPSAVRIVISTRNLWSDTAQLARLTIERQLELYHQNKSNAQNRSTSADATLFDAVATKIAHTIGRDIEQDVQAVLALPHAVVRRAMWRWD